MRALSSKAIRDYTGSLKLKFEGALEIKDCICAVYHLQVFDQSTIQIQKEKAASSNHTWCAEWFSIKSFLKEMTIHSSLIFKYRNVATVRETIMKNCVDVCNDHVFSSKSPPSHKAVICLVTYSDKIALENKDGFLWPLTSCITENECPLTKALVMLQQQGTFAAEPMKHNITSLGQTTSNGTITLIFRLDISKVCGPGKLIFSKHSELQ